MGQEKQNSEERAIDPSKVPFELLDKGGKGAEYPEVYLSYLKENWSTVCELMNWKNLPWKVFLEAKAPEIVVSSIQKELVRMGGDLGEQGVDGKFGSHTRSAVDQWRIARESKKALNAVELQVEEPTISGGFILEIGEEFKKGPKNIMEFINSQKFKKIMEIVEGANNELEKFGLNISPDEAEKFTQEQIYNYKKQCRIFRENLTVEEPRLKPLLNMGDKLIAWIEETMRSIDFSEVRTTEDLYKMMKKILPKLQEEMEGDENNSKQMEKLLHSLDFEVLMTFFMSVINEIKVSLAVYFKNQGKVSPLFKKMEEEEGFDGPRIKVEEESDWQNSGKVKFWHKGRHFVVNLEKGKMRRGLKSLFKDERILGCRLVGNDFMEIKTNSGVRRLTRDELVKMV